ncbi:MAG: serine/threonine protein kinase, bacterial [Blastocatellia bacterium]|jgi:serine/threonine protein kinase|nr:serine/threonine protein kinase, bacterial [Blastocatellia bacterium]
MPALQDYVGQVLDDKYQLERLLGQGGMGAVYLATHLGTGRFVALKLITPQFMGNEEFVERFKREAKAAGRLRHPNVVDVTDFGFAETHGRKVAYLVMEYLDGCTLGDVLREEQRLPLEWVVDILEQVCSAVHEAHQQGIVHRDLKPENIWLEPNRLGGYRVKVLDFGIAKLGDASTGEADGELDTSPSSREATPASLTDAGAGQVGQATQLASSAATQLAGGNENATAIPAVMSGAASTQFAGSANATSIGDRPEPATLLYGGANPGGSAAATSIQQSAEAAAEPADPADDDRTLMLDQVTRPLIHGAGTTIDGPHGQTTELTRVGAIMGTPLYMSPEQCAGKHIDARSDLYSLGVIVYQMLAGEPPFTGDTNKVMREHMESAPPPLRERRKVPKRVARLVMTALAKDPAERPQSAVAFANSLRAQADGVGTLYRRAFALYSEYFPKFLKMSLLAHSPVIVTTILMIGLQLAVEAQPKGWTITKISLLAALCIVALVHLIGYFVAASAISGMTALIVTQLQAAPLRPVELRTATGVLKRRWKPFLKTSIGVTLRVLLGTILFVIPGIVLQLRYAFYAPVVLVEGLEKKAARKRSHQLASRSWRTMIIVWLLQFLIPITVSFLLGQFHIGTKPPGVTAKGIHMQEITKQLMSLVNIIVVPLVSIVSALLYLKMRQLGGEPLSAALAQIEEGETRRSNWEQQMHTRLTLPTSRSGGSGQRAKS